MNNGPQRSFSKLKEVVISGNYSSLSHDELCMKATNGDDEGTNILWHIAKNNKGEVFKWLREYNFFKGFFFKLDDFRASPRNGRYKGVTVIWLLAKFTAFQKEDLTEFWDLIIPHLNPNDLKVSSMLKGQECSLYQLFEKHLSFKPYSQHLDYLKVIQEPIYTEEQKRDENEFFSLKCKALAAQRNINMEFTLQELRTRFRGSQENILWHVIKNLTIANCAQIIEPHLHNQNGPQLTIEDFRVQNPVGPWRYVSGLWMLAEKTKSTNYTRKNLRYIWKALDKFISQEDLQEKYFHETLFILFKNDPRFSKNHSLTLKHFESILKAPDCLAEIEAELLEKPLDEQMENHSEMLNLFEDLMELSELTPPLLVNPSPFRESNSPVLSAQTQNIIEPRAGIGSKYLGGQLPQLPKPKSIHSQQGSIYQECQRLVPLKRLPSSSKHKDSRRPYTYSSDSMEFILYTFKDMPSKQTSQVTFICAARKEAALVPNTAKGRVILLLTQSEYDSLNLPENIDALVIKKMQSQSHGNFNELLGCITTRRLAIFIVAHLLKLPRFCMIDDNIESVNFNSPASDGSWSDFYNLMASQLGEKGCVSIKTESFKIQKPGALGSKIFMINMALISSLLTDPYQMFLLFPIAEEALKWGEDYHMQLFLHQMLKERNQGYQIIDEGIASLVRSKANRNVCRKGGTVAKEFQMSTPQVLSNFSSRHQGWMLATLIKLNEIIRNNFATYNRQLNHLKQADLTMFHARSNDIAMQEYNPYLDEDETDFDVKFRSQLGRLKFKQENFRPFQLAAIDQVSQSSEALSRFVIATGAGKTILQCELARIAYTVANEGELTVIVTPYIDLVKQFYNDFIQFNESENVHNIDLKMPPQDVIQVSSNHQHINVQTLLINQPIKTKKALFIFCSDSFNLAVKCDPNFLGQIKLLLLDEYHKYSESIESFARSAADKGALVIGSSATPPKNDWLSNTLLKYTRAQAVEDGILAPVVADGLGCDFSEDNLSNLIAALPAIITHQNHPGFLDNTTLRSTKGIIFLPYIKDCENAHGVLNKAGIRNFAIHSSNASRKLELDQFLASDEPGVLIACDMLGIGFNDKNIAWIMIGRNANPESAAIIEQKMGRVMRRMADKAGYILAFDNVIRDVIRPLLRGQQLTLPLSADYLAEYNGYRNSKAGWQKVDMEMQGNRACLFQINPEPVRLGFVPDYAKEPSFENAVEYLSEEMVCDPKFTRCPKEALISLLCENYILDTLSEMQIEETPILNARKRKITQASESSKALGNKPFFTSKP
jgi:superfamily II DNA or RNA helicase